MLQTKLKVLIQVLIHSGIINFNSNVRALIYFQHSFISEGSISKHGNNPDVLSFRLVGRSV